MMKLSEQNAAALMRTAKDWVGRREAESSAATEKIVKAQQGLGCASEFTAAAEAVEAEFGTRFGSLACSLMTAWQSRFPHLRVSMTESGDVEVVWSHEQPRDLNGLVHSQMPLEDFAKLVSPEALRSWALTILGYADPSSPPLTRNGRIRAAFRALGYELDGEEGGDPQ